MPIADYRLPVHPNLLIAVFGLMAAADLLTTHLLMQQFLAGGRLATLGLSSAYLYSGMMMLPYAAAFARMQRSGASSIWAEVCTPWLALILFCGFPVLVAVQQRVVTALPVRLSEQARTRRRAAAAIAAAAVLALVAAVTAVVVAAADQLPELYQDGTPTVTGIWAAGVGLLATAVSLLAVTRDLRRRPPVERWVVVAISACLAGATLYMFASHRYTLGWYAGRVALLISSGVVLLALLAETATLYRQLSSAHDQLSATHDQLSATHDQLSAAHDDLDQAHRELSRRAEHLAAANLELEATGTWKSDIIATLTHEINQPLAVISAYSEELTHEWDTTTDDERRTAVQALGKRVTQLLDMAAHLLALCRSEPGQIHTQPIALPVQQALTRVTDNLTKQARKRVSASYGPPGATVWADPVHTHEVLTNFVTNAVKYSPGDIHLSAALDDTGNAILFAVSDEGKGVPPDFVAHLFDRFTQVGKTGPRTGAGFGLYLSKLLAEANHGQVWYEDVIPHGSRFMLRLPCTPAEPANGGITGADER
ncbi:sensor histidine kinase [Actinoplanes regularis]|uniref:sensor histidine kinase n=1 Tax=Actinoplanes regularis TaxID=52697 RepID=UPI002554C341|nr:HAMP domain-containing sensor histidine kinase [Actinoplanes regularis]